MSSIFFSPFMEARYLLWKDLLASMLMVPHLLVGSIIGFDSLVKHENLDIISAHCFICRVVLISKLPGDELKKFLMTLQNGQFYERNTS